jgi:TolB protein
VSPCAQPGRFRLGPGIPSGLIAPRQEPPDQDGDGQHGGSYSPSGKKIVYSSYDGTHYELYKINAGGGGKVQLTDNNMDDYYSSYSPNGKRIAYQGKDSPTGDFEIYTIKAGGGGKVPVTDNGTRDFYPSWGSS